MIKIVTRVVLVGLGVCFLALILGALLVGTDRIPWPLLVLSLIGGMIGGIGMELSDRYEGGKYDV